MATAPPTARADAPQHGFEFRTELVAHARRSLGREHDAAEDIVQEAFVHLLRRARDGNPPRDARPWLYTVVSSLCIREQSRARRETPAEMDGGAAPSGDPAQIAQVQAELRWALSRVADLPAREQAVLIADLVGVPQERDGANARYQALHRARRKLRAIRAEAWGLLPFPLIRWPTLFGSGHAGLAAGVGGAPGALAGAGIVKGAVVAASVVVALGGGQMLASIPGPESPPAAPTVVSAPTIRPAGPLLAAGPASGQAADAPGASAGRGGKSARTDVATAASRPASSAIPVSAPAPTHPAGIAVRPADAPSTGAEPVSDETEVGAAQEEARDPAARLVLADGDEEAPGHEDGPSTGSEPAGDSQEAPDEDDGPATTDSSATEDLPDPAGESQAAPERPSGGVG